MNLITLPSGVIILDGTFFTIQRGDLAKSPANGWRFDSEKGRRVPVDHATDSHGNPRLEWPGRSVFETRAQALDIAAKLASSYSHAPYFVMQAIDCVAQASPPLAHRRLV